MSKSLIIVESPAKAKTINKYLGPEFKVAASMGHIKDLPKVRLGVDIRNNFKPKYEIIPERKKILKELKSLAAGVDNIYLAPDPDREGEAIAWHLSQELNVEKPISRLTFNEITKPAIQKALEYPGKIDINKVDAQQARRILDRLVGYLISPILNKKVQKGLSAGRVQSVALRLICEREQEIETFIPKEYWSITAKLQNENQEIFNAKLEKIDNKKIEISDKDKTEAILKELKDKEFIVDKVTKKDKQQNPILPFITSTLQQEAARKLGFSAKKTMLIAQQLYEGLDVGEEAPVGIITYMRTDAVRISSEAQLQARQYIKDEFGTQYLPAKPPQYKSKKLAQEAHEAIRPTDVFRKPNKIKEYLNDDQYKLYKLIWTRFIASQMSPALLEITRAEILVEDKFLFVATGTVVKFDGFMAIYTEGKDEEEEEKKDILPQLKTKERLKLVELIPKQHFTQPPPRYTEATLVKALEEKGIGRPSTYATIISTIQERDYVKLKDKKFYPTELGKLVTELLVKSFPDILDVGFTAQLEDKLDKIEEGELDWISVLNDFYTPFKDSLIKAEKIMSEVKKQQEKITSILCEKCNNPMIIKTSKLGKFLACSGYPKCRNIKHIELKENGEIEIKEDEKTEIVCDICGMEMVIKHGQYGKFLACSGYPKCKNIKSLEQKTTKETIISDIKCEKCNTNMVLREGKYGKFLSCSNYPKCKFSKSINSGFKCPTNCGGELTRKRSKKGFFYGCSNYPKCNFATWGEPLEKECPECGYIVVRCRRNGTQILACSRKECNYEEIIEVRNE